MLSKDEEMYQSIISSYEERQKVNNVVLLLECEGIFIE